MWKGGFSLDPGARIRGFVELYDGDVYLFSCLATAMHTEAGEQVFHIKEQTPFHATAPSDFPRGEVLPLCALAAFEASRIGL